MFRRSTIAFALSILLAACGPGGGADVPPDNGPDISGVSIRAYGGRERAEVRCSGLPSSISGIAITLDAAAGAMVFTPDQIKDGRIQISGLAEKSYSCPVALILDGSTVSAGTVDFVVYGSKYESFLPAGGVNSSIFSGAGASLAFQPVNHYSYCGYQLEYTSVKDEHKSLFLGKEDAAAIFLNDVNSDISARPAFKPEEEMEDLFYGPEFTIKSDSGSEDIPLNDTVDGYRGIWFDLGQAASSYGSKYSGGFATYTMKHIPMAIYSPVVNRTFFVYGGTPAEDKKYLLCMVGCFDHSTGMLQKPRIVMDKGVLGVADPHDNPTIQIDRNGFVWVFVAGRSNKRNGVRYRSRKPYDITSFEYINEDLMAYPQVMYHPDKGFFLFYTRYDGTRQLFWRTSANGVDWSDYKQLASIKESGDKNSGHYQISNIRGTKLCTAFNRHINGNVDTRTNIYYLQSEDWGQTWTTAAGEKVTVPVTERYSNCLVRDYQISTEEHNCYIKDLNFDADGNPIILHLTSRSHLTGPDGGTRQWHVIHWTGSTWDESLLTTSTHCYDSGSLWVDGNDWVVIAPTEPGPQYWGTGGEVVKWKSSDEGKTWTKVAQLTNGSALNQSYMRRPWYAADGFYCFWADGNPDEFTKSCLYFCDKNGSVYRMPYEMSEEWAKPEKL